MRKTVAKGTPKKFDAYYTLLEKREYRLYGNDLRTLLSLPRRIGTLVAAPMEEGRGITLTLEVKRTGIKRKTVI